MVVFDNWKFREILKSIVEKKELNGDRISSKQQLYMRIGEALHVSPDTVKYWQRDKSSGPDPRTPELLKKLENYLGYPTGALLKKINNDYKDTERRILCSVMERMFPDGGETYTIEEVKRLFEEEGLYSKNFEDALSKCIEEGWIIDCGNGNYTK